MGSVKLTMHQRVKMSNIKPYIGKNDGIDLAAWEDRLLRQLSCKMKK